MIGLALKFALGGFSWVRDFIRANPSLAIIIALCAALAGLWWVHSGTVKELAEANQTIAQFKAATKKAQAETKRIETASKEIAHEADKQADAVTIVYRDRVLRLPSAASASAASKDNAPGSTDGPGSDPVILERSDALICAENTSRLQAAHDWAINLQQLQSSGEDHDGRDSN
jgi:hypothetical protein